MGIENKEMRQLYDSYSRLPHGKERLAAIRSAVVEADHAADHFWRMGTRYDELIEQLFHGDPGCVLPLAGEIVAMFEEQPIYRFRSQYLWVLCTAVGQWSHLPQLPLEQRQDMMKHFWDAAQRYQMGHQSYYERAFYQAVKQEQREAAEEAWQNWLNTTTPDVYSCAACKQYFRVWYALYYGDAGQVEKEARPLLDKSLSCEQEPERTLSLLLSLALDCGDRKQADQWGIMLRPYLQKENGELKYDSAMLRWLAYYNLEEGLRMLVRELPDHLNMWSQSNQYDFFRAAWACFRELAKQQDTVLLKLTEDVPFYREDGIYNCAALEQWFHDEAEAIGQRFDRRNNSHFYEKDMAVTCACEQ